MWSQFAAALGDLGARRLRAHMRRMKDMPLSETILPPLPRDYHGMNWEGLKTLYMREVRRFLKVGQQTLPAPVVTALPYNLGFVVGGGGGPAALRGPFRQFLASGPVIKEALLPSLSKHALCPTRVNI